jgi:hypothetical protein
MDLTPILACGPSFSPDFILIGLAWLVTIPLSLTNVILTAVKCASDRRMIHFSILGVATIATLNIFGAFPGGITESFASAIRLVSIFAVPILIAGQFVTLVFDRSKKEQSTAQ